MNKSDFSTHDERAILHTKNIQQMMTTLIITHTSTQTMDLEVIPDETAEALVPDELGDVELSWSLKHHLANDAEQFLHAWCCLWAPTHWLFRLIAGLVVNVPQGASQISHVDIVKVLVALRNPKPMGRRQSTSNISRYIEYEDDS